jgi:hypothetical protein
MNHTDTMRLALEAVEIALSTDEDRADGYYQSVITALTAALAEPSEPVYWQWRRKAKPWATEYIFSYEALVTTDDSEVRKLYTHPPVHQPLTEFERMQIIGNEFPLALVEAIVIQKIDSVCIAIEAAIRGKT